MDYGFRNSRPPTSALRYVLWDCPDLPAYHMLILTYSSAVDMYISNNVSSSDVSNRRKFFTSSNVRDILHPSHSLRSCFCRYSLASCCRYCSVDVCRTICLNDVIAFDHTHSCHICTELIFS